MLYNFFLNQATVADIMHNNDLYVFGPTHACSLCLAESYSEHFFMQRFMQNRKHSYNLSYFFSSSIGATTLGGFWPALTLREEIIQQV